MKVNMKISIKKGVKMLEKYPLTGLKRYAKTFPLQTQYHTDLSMACGQF